VVWAVGTALNWGDGESNFRDSIRIAEDCGNLKWTVITDGFVWVIQEGILQGGRYDEVLAL